MLTNHIPMAKFAKTDARYWQDRVFLPQYTRDGERYTSRHYSVRIHFQGVRESFSLYTGNKAAAAAKARDIYTTLVTQGWAATRERFKPTQNQEPESVVTVADFFRRIRETHTGREGTLEEYFSAFRLIVAESFGIDGAKEKYDYQSGGRTKWLKQVEEVRLTAMTPERVQRWKVAFLKRAGTDPVKVRTARTSVNSLLRKAKSLFSPKRLRFAGDLGLPFSSPFEDVEFEPRQSMRYHSSVDLEKLTREAVKELTEQELKVFLLASMGGLRRNEIDKLEWPAFHWEQSILRIENTKHFQTKNEGSRGEVDLDPEFCALFRGFHAKAAGPFVIESPIKPRLRSNYRHYRCNKVFTSLFAWLRSKGVKSANPLHTLRKEFGSRINDAHGIYAASRALRHADIAITSQHYLDKKSRATVGLGHLLRSAGEHVASTYPLSPDSGGYRLSSC
jgi:integrase